MYALWRPEPASAVPPTMVATLHGFTLRVEPEEAHRWHWSVLTSCGHEVEAGEAPTLVGAENEAEAEVLAVHPPGSLWNERCID
ncbi:MAG TPA: hypothetical protein VIV06_04615 [Candidatus Limnocylindrales bacterium]